jgi:CMP-N-acetylneuraminic acid synthetase
MAEPYLTDRRASIRSLCVIPARRDSKRVSTKPLRRIADRTLIERCLDVAVGSGAFDVIVLSTEDDEIAEFGRRAGVDVLDRPASLLGDDVGVGEIVLAVGNALAAAGTTPDAVTCLSPPYPLLQATSVAHAHLLFAESDANFLMSTVPTDPHDFHWALRKVDGYAEMFFGNEFLMDRMHLPAVHSPTGAIKIARWESLERRRFFFGEKLLPYEMTRAESLYVGDELDLEFAAYLLEQGTLAPAQRSLLATSPRPT